MRDQSEVDNRIIAFKRRGYESAAARRTKLRDLSTRHLALTLLPVILVVCVRMLLAKPVLAVAVWGCTIAVGAAIVLTYVALTSIVVRVVISGDAVSIDDAWSVRKPAQNPARHWFRVLDVRGTTDHFTATIGLETHHFDRSEWPAFDEMQRRLKDNVAIDSREV